MFIPYFILSLHFIYYIIPENTGGAPRGQGRNRPAERKRHYYLISFVYIKLLMYICNQIE